MKPKLNFSWRIFLVAFVLRLIPVLLKRSLGTGLDDMFQYDMLARSLASGNGFRWYAYEDLQRLEPYGEFDLASIDYDHIRGAPTSFRAPLYPAFLALIYRIVGAGRFFAVRLVQAGLSAVLAPLTYLVSCRLFPGNKSASVISAWIVTCYPMLIIYPIGLATENLFFLFVLAAFYFLLRIPDSRSSIHHSLLSGIFLALAVLTRSVAIPFAGLAVLWTWFILKQKRAAVLIALTLFALVLPWVVRNSLLHQKLTSVETSMGYNLYVGYHPESDGSFTFGPSLDLLPILDDAERDLFGKYAALDFILAEPERFLPLAINRLGFFFGLEKRALMYFYSNNLLGYIPTPLLVTVAGVMLLPFVIVSISAVWGLMLARIRPGVILLYLLFIPYIFVRILILTEDRFHLALLPYLAILAARAWTGGWTTNAARWRESPAGKVAVGFAVLAVLLFFLNWGFELSRDADKIAELLGPYGNQTNFSY